MLLCTLFLLVMICSPPPLCDAKVLLAYIHCRLILEWFTFASVMLQKREGNIRMDVDVDG